MPRAAVRSCANDLCTCSPCRCGASCRCGGAPLGELESQVMAVLWSAEGDCSGRMVADTLRPHAYTTVATVLERLVKKGLVERREEGRRIRYSAKGSRAAHSALLIRRELDTADADAGATLDALVRLLSTPEKEALRRSLTRPRGRPR